MGKGLVVAALVCAGCSGVGTGKGGGPIEPEPADTPIVGGRDLRSDPPRVESMEAMLLDAPSKAGNALLRVKLAKGERVGPAVTINADGRRFVLRDDGRAGDEKADDHVFSTIFRLDVADLAAKQAALIERMPRENLAFPEFDGRAVKQRLPFRPFDFVRLKPRIPFPFPPFPTTIAPSDVLSGSSLMITNVAVVEDSTRTFNPCAVPGASNPNGVWTFKHLVTEMSAPAGLDPRVFTRRLLEKWMSNQTVNTFSVASRTQMEELVLRPWRLASGGPDAELDLDKAPFRLLAIVNRVDLADNLVYGAGSAGEGRFVFGVLGPSCSPLPFTVIFEYGVEAKGCTGLKSWAKQWFDLKDHPIGSPAYNAALEAITEQFARANAAPSKPNGSALNQLRTNEIALAGPWELREFRIDPLEGGHLREVTVKQNPDLGLNGQPRLETYVEMNATDIVALQHEVPLDFPAGQPFLGGSAPTPGGAFAWNHPGILPREARHKFSFATCNGCHAGETRTSFTHVGVAPFGTEAPLSGFLTGVTVDDPIDGSPTRTFNDLLFRQERTAEIVGGSCFRLLTIPKLKMVH